MTLAYGPHRSEYGPECLFKYLKHAHCMHEQFFSDDVAIRLNIFAGLPCHLRQHAPHLYHRHGDHNNLKF